VYFKIFKIFHKEIISLIDNEVIISFMGVLLSPLVVKYLTIGEGSFTISINANIVLHKLSFSFIITLI
jgi:hypothetical protein